MGEACGRPAAAVHRACSNNHPLLGAEQADFVHADSTTATEADVITLGRRVLIIGLALALPLARPAAAQRRADAEPSLPPVNTRPIEALGLDPAGPSGSYFQPVALVGMTPQPTLVWGKGSDTPTPRYGDDFVAWAERPEEHIAVDGDVVFVGYGTRAPEWQWDDYKRVPLRGKVLLMLVNDPGLQDSTIFNGKALTYYGRWTYKLEEAARQGALGALLVHTTESATYPWDVVRGSWSVEQFMLDRPRTQSLAFAGWVQHDLAQRALAQVGLDLDSLTRAAARRDFRPVSTGIHAAVEITSALRHVESENVVAKLPGSDPRLGREAVLFTAHWDHKGIGPAVNGDSIYNGAEDNASGVAAILAAAQALVEVTPRPRRTILFIATTAEESGLLR